MPCHLHRSQAGCAPCELKCNRLGPQSARSDTQGGTADSPESGRSADEAKSIFRMKTSQIALGGLILSLTLLSISRAATCQIKIENLPVTMDGQVALLPAKVNGIDVNFRLDSGSFYSSINPGALENLKLHRRQARNGILTEGVGGLEWADFTSVDRLTIGKAEYLNHKLLIDGSEFGSNAIGMLGQDYLSGADFEYDLANGVVRHVQPGENCSKANLAYWASQEDVREIDLLRPEQRYATRIAGIATVNGAEVRVMFDTGARSIISLKAAKRAGIEPGGPGVVPGELAYGFGHREVQTWIAPIKNVTIGEEKINHTHIRIGDFELSDVDMIIGIDFFLSHRIFVANSQRKLYFTYNGGPIFNLFAVPSLAHRITNAENPPDLPAKDSSPPVDADGFSRRGAAYASRQSFDLALSDLTRACELNPGVGKYFSQRGSVRLRLGQSSLAMSDFNEALRLNPDDVDTRVKRADLNASGQDLESARADLSVADKVVGRGAYIRLDIAGIYLHLDMLELALSHFNLWISAHSQEPDLNIALYGRCWVRALMGKELNKALDDCGAAIAARPEEASYRDSRGLVQLRLGRLDDALADYDAALRINPKIAWSLYGRGLIRLRNGATDAGNADIAAAKAIRPSIEDDAKRHGVRL
jgi:tetratricopeptide (TPR) repeat protein